MPLFMDIHYKIAGLTADAVAKAHLSDLRVQSKHNVNFTHYWFDETTGRVFCLFEGPSAKAGELVHAEAHGLVADEIVEVREGR